MIENQYFLNKHIEPHQEIPRSPFQRNLNSDCKKIQGNSQSNIKNIVEINIDIGCNETNILVNRPDNKEIVCSNNFLKKNESQSPVSDLEKLSEIQKNDEINVKHSSSIMHSLIKSLSINSKINHSENSINVENNVKNNKSIRDFADENENKCPDDELQINVQAENKKNISFSLDLSSH